MSEPADPRARDPRVATRGGEAGESPAFEAPYPRTYGRPDRDRLKRAFHAYVQGHDRGWGAERKRLAAEASLEVEARMRRGRAPSGRPEPAGVAAPAGLASGAGRWPTGDLRSARFGVPVPERLDYHRGPDTWRSRFEGSGTADEE